MKTYSVLALACCLVAGGALAAQAANHPHQQGSSNPHPIRHDVHRVNQDRHDLHQDHQKLRKRLKKNVHQDRKEVPQRLEQARAASLASGQYGPGQAGITQPVA